jgi:hypothetical protein
MEHIARLLSQGCLDGALGSNLHPRILVDSDRQTGRKPRLCFSLAVRNMWEAVLRNLMSTDLLDSLCHAVLL